ncbi:HupE/UreJ family protein [Shewanella avicenniae]|uniref:HupE/UreJ family protein n=1 Tax=Shewanella avicenniae TaxID=2814294 RepID=A0ABX7QS38_9GAMM|nr:HupE/UreJ family protein [Shewanella avicenniae]QSX34069.1 HupE/UreJ family protein [Shewanella avicenniae]
MELMLRVLVLLLVFLGMPVYAGSSTPVASFTSGFLHPLLAMDHIVVAVSVGMLCRMMLNRVVCLVPLAFLFFMMLGGIAGMLQISMPFVSFSVAASVIAIGILMAVDHQWPLSFIMAFVGALAVFHGYAHGADMPERGQAIDYAIGFIAGTALLQLIGVGLGFCLNQFAAPTRLLRYTGGAVAAFGGYLVLALML